MEAVESNPGHLKVGEFFAIYLWCIPELDPKFSYNFCIQNAIINFE